MSPQAHTGLTLEGIAQRLEALERQNERMRSENAELRHAVAALRGSETRRAEEERPSSELSGFGGQVSRRALLSKAGAAAVAAVAAGTLLATREAKADHYADGIEVNFVHTHEVVADEVFAASVGATSSVSTPAVRGYNISTRSGSIGVEGDARPIPFTGSEGGTGVIGRGGPIGVKGQGKNGVIGTSSTTGYGAVYGQHTGSSGYGIVGDGTGGGAGVLGRNSDGEGVRGEGSTQAEVAGVRGLGKVGVWGSSSVFGYEGVYGQHTGTGWGVVGDGKGGSYAGVFGRNNTGYGGRFEGGKAQLMLTPGGSAGKPTTGTHSKGEIYMDSRGTLFVCTAGDGTTLGSWRKVNTTAV
jgi:hypothetical protein